MSNEASKAADALGAAIKARSSSMLNDLYDDQIVVWHGSTGKGMGKKENIGLLQDIFDLTSAMEYRNIRRYAIEGGGVVQQHQLTGTFNDGKPLPALEACMVIKTRDGKITNIDEYFDGASFADVWARLDEYRQKRS